MAKQKITLGLLCELAELDIKLAANIDEIVPKGKYGKRGFFGLVNGE